ncbi:MAG: TetR/AcrR family transcriptional regulator [Pseudomonadota bacterium]
MPKGSKKSAIIDAAFALARREGSDAVTARKVCAAAGVTPPTLYYHFSSQEGLREAVVEAAFERALGETHKETLQDPVAEIVRGWDAYVAFASAEPAIFSIMNASIISDTLPMPAAMALQTLSEQFEQLDRWKGNPKAAQQAALTVWAAAHGIATMSAAAELGGVPVVPHMSAAMRSATLSTVGLSGVET